MRYGQTLAIENVCLDVKKGDFLGIIGPNGGGKTTLLKAILGLNKKYTGKIEIAEKNGKKLQIGYVPQFASMNRGFPISVLEVAMTACMPGTMHPFFRYSDSDKEKAMEQLKRVGIENLANRKVKGLSGGEFQRLLIARALTLNPDIMLLDEPTASVDPKSCSDIYELFKELNKNMTIVMVTHDTTAIASQVKSIACLNKTLIYHGEPKLTEETVNALYHCPVDLIAHGVPHRVLKNHTHGGESHD